jgi:8-oxo-dGTP pyrophosphatase MutT (NUDIX family)
MILQENQAVNVVVRGLMFKKEHLLVTQWKNDGIVFCIGGRVDFGESVVDAVRREVREETRAEITINKLLYFNEHSFVSSRGVHYHELGWYFWVEPDREICGLDEVIQNPDHPDLIIRYLKVEDAPAHDFWPTFLPQYLLTDIKQGFSQNPRHIHGRDNGTDPKMTREVAGLYDHLIHDPMSVLR